MIGVGYASGVAGGLPFNNATVGVAANQVAGGHVALPLANLGEVGLTLATFSSNSNSTISAITPYNNIVLYGANVTFKNLGRFTFHAEGAKTVTGVGADNSGTLGSEISGNEDNNYYTWSPATIAAPSP